MVYPNVYHTRFSDWKALVINVAATTAVWIAVTFLTRPTDEAQLRSFYRAVQPGGPGWRSVVRSAAKDGQPVEDPGVSWDVPLGILCTLIGCVLIWAAVLGTGYWIYANYAPAVALTLVTIASAAAPMRLWSKLSTRET